MLGASMHLQVVVVDEDTIRIRAELIQPPPGETEPAQWRRLGPVRGAHSELTNHAVPVEYEHLEPVGGVVVRSKHHDHAAAERLRELHLSQRREARDTPRHSNLPTTDDCDPELVASSIRDDLQPRGEEPPDAAPVPLLAWRERYAARRDGHPEMRRLLQRYRAVRAEADLRGRRIPR